MTCPECEYHKTRAARWRAEAYKQSGHDVIELPWVGLTDEEVGGLTVFSNGLHHVEVPILADLIRAIEAKLKEKNT